MKTEEPKTRFLPLDALASALGLPRNWLRAQAEAGVIPCIRIGTRCLFDVESVRARIVELTKEPRNDPAAHNI